MLARVRKRITTELSYFKLLSPDARRMLLSYVLYLAALPIITLFVNAYLWRSGHDIWRIIIYNVGYFVGLPLGFYFNGFLVKRFHMLRIYLIGAVLQGAVPCILVFFHNLPLAGLCAYGMIYGFGGGLFWGNKNYLDQQITRGANRLYYNTLGQITDTLVNVLVPLCTGWFIVLLNVIRPSTSLVAYKVVMPVGFILLFFSGFIMQFSTLKNIVIKGMGVTHKHAAWQNIRLFNLLYNLQFGFMWVVYGVLILILVGNEGILGTIQTITGLISALVLYLIGRKSSIASSWKFIGIGSIVFLLGAGALAANFTWIGAVVFSLVASIAYTFQWSASYSVLMETMDHEETNPEKQYSYICDNELFFNIGRMVGVSIISVIIVLGSEHAALRFSPLIIALLELPMAFIILAITNRIHPKNR